MHRSEAGVERGVAELVQRTGLPQYLPGQGGSTPIITTATTYPFLTIHARWDRGRHALLQIGHRRTLLRATPRQSRQADTSFESQTANRPAADMRAKPCRTSERYDLGRNACIDSSIRRISRGSSLPGP
jgi:hypothetical protein